MTTTPRFLKKTVTRATAKMKGTPRYIAPELSWYAPSRLCRLKCSKYRGNERREQVTVQCLTRSVGEFGTPLRWPGPNSV